jgi:hypothetical protein
MPAELIRLICPEFGTELVRESREGRAYAQGSIRMEQSGCHLGAS